MPNWLFLTGTRAQLEQVWRRYGAAPAEILPAGSMIGHGDYAFVIDQAGHLRRELGLRHRPRHPGHQVLVRRRTDRRRPPAAGALMNRPARPALIALALPSAAAHRGLRQPRRVPGRGRRPRRHRAGRRSWPPPWSHRPAPGPSRSWAVPSPRTTTSGSCSPARPGAAGWKLVTPPGVADNGGLVAADAGGGSLITGIRPSQYLTYTPLAITRDGGQAWSPAGPLDAALADTPDALAAAPGTGRLLALLTSGTVKVAAPGYTRWATLATRRSLAATPAGRRCGLTEPHRGRVHRLRGRRCWPAGAAAPEPPASSPPATGPGRPPGPHSPPRWATRPPPCSG